MRLSLRLSLPAVGTQMSAGVTDAQHQRASGSVDRQPAVQGLAGGHLTAPNLRGTLRMVSGSQLGGFHPARLCEHRSSSVLSLVSSLN